MTMRRSRSLRGCSTCRTRHIKCDESQPSCLICMRDGIECGGYEARILFDDADGLASTHFRRPLFTDLEQERQADLLRSSLRSCPANHLLEEIEDTVDTAGGDVLLAVSRGPFGVFRHQAASSSIYPSLENSDVDTESSTTTFTSVIDPYQKSVEDLSFEGCGATFEDLDVGALDAVQDFVDELGDAPLQVRLEDYREILELPESLVTDDEPDSVLRPDISIRSEIMPNAQMTCFLLSNYRDSVIPRLSLFASQKTPWHVLHLPSSMNTFASLSMGDQPNDANLASFYANMAMSCFNLHDTYASSELSSWQQRGCIYKSNAERHLLRSLLNAFSRNKTAKYKDILLALLTMITVSLFSEEWGLTEKYIVEVENFIRLKGLPKRNKSRKIRLLHHCYAHLRIFYESMFPLHNDVSLANTNSGAVRHDSTPSEGGKLLRIGNWDSNLSYRMLESKDVLQGENDLLLEVPGKWHLTMYPQIYGMPEDMLFLLSQAVRLGNEREISELSSSGGTLSLHEFTRRAKALERCILDWKMPDISSFEDSSTEAVYSMNRTSFGMVQTLLTAMHNALSIYFYQRIYDIDASILQNQVSRIVSCVQDYENSGSNTIKSSAFVWPALIAACGTLSADMQRYLTGWMKSSALRSGLRSFSAAHEIAQEVWSRRLLSGERDVAWLEVIRNHPNRLLYL